MKKYKLLYIFICCLFISTNTFATEQNLTPQNLTLNDALNLALENNDLINASMKAKDFAKYEKRAAQGKYLPNLYVHGSATRINDPIVLHLGDARTAIIGASAYTYYQAGGEDPNFTKNLSSKLPDFSMKFQDELFYHLTANLVYPIFTGGKIVANSKAKKAEYEISKFQYDITVNSTITSVIDNYFMARFALEIMNIREYYLNDIKQHAINAQKLFDVGMISKTNKLRADVALTQAQREFEKSQRDYKLTLVVLSNVLGKSVENCILSSKLQILDELKEQTFYLQASTNNLSLKALNKKQTLVQQKITSIRAEFLPTIALFGKYELYQDNLTVFEPKWAAGVNAKLDIFNGFSDLNDYKAYKAQLDSLKLNIEHVSKMITTAIKKYHHEAETAKQQYDSLQSSLELTKENLKLYKQSFKEGLATSIEVIDAELALEKVILDQQLSVYEYNVAYSKLIDLCNLSRTLLNITISGEYENDEE